jgi:hypothetical protein
LTGQLRGIYDNDNLFYQDRLFSTVFQSRTVEHNRKNLRHQHRGCRSACRARQGRNVAASTPLPRCHELRPHAWLVPRPGGNEAGPTLGIGPADHESHPGSNDRDDNDASNPVLGPKVPARRTDQGRTGLHASCPSRACLRLPVLPDRCPSLRRPIRTSHKERTCLRSLRPHTAKTPRRL